ncbi:hypothetical protein D0B54_14790 [Solimonas sp. K1W22B-7]|uniref:hypothetical protein n=1 Tax=Solimonas sp. K1W22B-7 TaxID=2303331 RepID=UPI000E32DE40|nr:hypothetical protein [Solimonas sp. K1W22B-7]AXQ29865.1 hypothetical protein D0B54_14790 [Solimonas sp. K1W22B-7]
MNPDFAARHPRLAELFGIDLRSLALFRFLLGSLLFCALCGSLCGLTAFYSDGGLLPRGWVMASDSPWRLSLYFLNGTTLFSALLLLAQIALAAMLALGWHTRLAAVLGFLLQASLVSRAPLVAGSADLLLTCLLFWSAFLPLGARWSVDAALAANPPPRDPLHISWAGAGLLLQILSVYFFNALLRSGSEWRQDSSALYYLLSLDGHATALGHWLLQHTGLLETLSSALWWLSLLAAPLALLPLASRYTRLALLPLLALMQLLILLAMNQGPLPLLGLAGLSVLLAGGFWQWCARHRPPPAGNLRIYHDRERPASLRNSLLLQQFLVLPQAQLLAAQDAPRARALLAANRSWVVIDTDDQAYLRWAALAALLRHSPLLSWLYRPAKLAAVERLGDRLHGWLARTPAAAAAASGREVRWEAPESWQRCAAAFLLLVLAWNAASVGWLPSSTQAVLAPILQPLRLDQSWNMDAPSPPRDGGWFVAAGRLEDGREIDLLRSEALAPDYSQPAIYDDGLRWRRLRERLALDAYAAHRPYYARWLCRQADSRDGPQLASVRLVQVLRATPPPGGATPQPEQRILLQQDCAARG